MIRIVYPALLLSSVLIISCQSGSEKKSAEEQADATVVTDSIHQPKDSIINDLTDPDPTDTIPATAYGINSYRKEAVTLVKSSLQDLYRNDLAKNLVDSLSRRFVIFEYDINDDNQKEIFVGLNGHYFCGTGGCTVLLLSPEGKLITRFTVTETPIVISRNRTKNWNDLILNSKGQNYLLKFDGKKYPSNPSVQPLFKTMPGDELPRLLDYEHEAYPWFQF